MQRLRLFLVVAFVLSLFVVPTAGAAGPDRSITLSADKTSFAAAEPVIVHVTYANNSARTVRTLRWLTPADGVEEALFSVSRDGQAVAYLGPVFKRPAPTAEDYVAFAPGGRRTFDVDLASVYDLSMSGTYVVRFNADRWTSNELVLAVEGRASGPAVDAAPAAVNGTTTFNKCSSTQQSQLLTARANASTYAANSVTYLGGALGSRYTTWFGAYTASRYNKVNANFGAIKSAMDNAAVTFDCGCKKKYYAYVYPTQPYTIYLCSVYWNAPATGTDSKAGTLIHEMSHFNVVAGTDDYVYGQSGAKSLAISNPDQAVDNADNHEYFAENTPFQN